MRQKWLLSNSDKTTAFAQGVPNTEPQLWSTIKSKVPKI